MKRLDNKLKLSVSLLALMSGGAIVASTAHAVTISGAQNSVVITTDVSDLTVDSTGDVSPGGILVQGAVAGDVTNNGIIEFLDSPIASNTDFVVAEAIGLEVEDGIGGSFSNTNTINAVADASVTVIGDFSTDGAIAELAPSGAEAFASGVTLNTVGGSISNTKSITASANADASSDITANSGKGTSDVDGGSESTAEAYGLDADLGEGDFTNAKDATISATATASSDVLADVNGTSATLFDAAGEDVFSEAQAYGVYVDGGDAIVNDGTIGASASSSAVFDGLATGTTGEGLIGGEGFGVNAYSSALGLEVGDDATSVSNTGAITGDAHASGSLTAGAAGDTAFVGADNSVVSNAGGIVVDGAIGSFNNAGPITVTGSSDLTGTVNAVGDKGADIELNNGVSSNTYGVILNQLDGPLSNSGAISSTSTASLDLVADAGAGDVAPGTTEVGSFVTSSAWGVMGEDFDGDFSNAKGASIAADAAATSSVDIGAAGATSADSDGFTGSQTVTMANAIGVALSGGEDGEDGPDTNTVKNEGAISAKAAASSTVDASTNTTGAGASAGTESGSLTGALAAGLLDLGDATSFDNSGTIDAQATASHLGTFSANGDVDSGLGADSILYAAAIGAGFVNPIDGNVTNSGTINAVATGSYDVAVGSNITGDLGGITTNNIAVVGAVGLYANVEAPSGEGDVASNFTNSGTISAKGDLTIDISQPAATETVTPEQNTLGGLVVAGAVVDGAPAIVDNSGTISATGSLNSTGVAGDNSVTAAGVVGLWLPSADDGLVINNSGKITADLSGNAQESASVGLLVGQLPEGLLDDVLGGEELPTDTILPLAEGGEGDAEALAEGVITINNTGTISGLNKTEGGLGFGIFAETAPVPLVINQMGGLIEGTTAAIAMDQGNADTLNWSGGSISGLVDADETDVVNVIQALDKDGKPVDTTVTAGNDFILEGAGQLNVGEEGAPVTFVMNGLVTNVGETNLNKDGALVMGPTAKIDTGTFNQSSGSTLVIQFDPTTAGLITTTGDFNAAGDLEAQALPGLYGDSGSHIVIDAGGVVAGKFDNAGTVGDTLLIDFTTTVNPSDVTVSWKRNAFDSVAGLSDNSASVAGALEEGYDPTRPPSKNAPELNDQIGGLFTLTDPVLYDRVLNSWSGSEYAQVMRAATNLSQPYLMALSEHLNDNRWGFKEQRVVMLRPDGSSNSIAPASSVGQSGAEDARASFWARGFGQWSSTRADANADGFDEDAYGVVLGMDYRVTPNILIGLVGSYISDDIKFDDGDDGQIDRWSVGGYVSGTWDLFYADGSFTYVNDDYKVNRTIITGGAGCLAYNCTVGASGDYGGDGWIAHAEAGYNWLLGGTAKLQPFVGLNFTDVDADPFSETGGGDLGLDVLDGTGKSFQSRLGARLSGEWGSGDVKWVPEIRAEWRHEFEDNPAWIQASLVGLPNDPFVAVGSHVSRDLAVIGAGITAQMTSGWGFFLDYQGAFASGYTSHIAQGGVRVKF